MEPSIKENLMGLGSLSGKMVQVMKVCGRMIKNMEKVKQVTLGKYIFDNGDFYEGDFSNDVQNGFGTLTKESGLTLQR
jgi:hypothetical protein